MREILFRGKRVDNGEWVYGDLSQHKTGKKFIKCGSAIHSYEVIPKSIGQYTGLTDKNAKKIFEGYICRFREWGKGEMCWVGKILFLHQQFAIAGPPNKECDSPFYFPLSRINSNDVEIIGNIHDNPELLEVGNNA